MVDCVFYYVAWRAYHMLLAVASVDPLTHYKADFDIPHLDELVYLCLDPVLGVVQLGYLLPDFPGSLNLHVK